IVADAMDDQSRRYLALKRQAKFKAPLRGGGNASGALRRNLGKDKRLRSPYCNDCHPVHAFVIRYNTERNTAMVINKIKQAAEIAKTRTNDKRRLAAIDKVSSAKPGSHFCPKKNDDGSYCKSKA